ncbi:MFS transporter [Lysinibacillus antri]|uniref:MFS transporter n=1 Tax=Lysinibacillus antri TaxID=2498145 RepID=A0A3S0P2F8_9BACI|nr:MFS transporter [Lysinibacillus antri]RUL48704.1 MFS transporter [Lysinibacillus antri]
MSILKKNSPSYPLLTFILTWAGFIILMSMYFPIPLTEEWMTTYHISETKAIWIGSSFALCYGICCLLYGPLSDQFGRKIFLIIGICILTIATFICAFLVQYEVLIVFRILQAIGAAAFVPISLVYVGEVFPPDQRLRAISFITSGFLISNIVAQVFGSIIYYYYGHKWIYIILAILYLATAILTILYLPKETSTKHQNSIILNFFNIKKLFFNKQLCISFFITFTLLFSLIGMYTILGQILSNAPFYFTENQILTVRAVGLLAIVASIFSKQITNRFGTIRSVKASMLLAALSLFIMGLSNSPLLVIMFSLFFVASIALVIPINMSLINERAATQRGTAILFNAFILFVGASIGPILTTKLMDYGNAFIAFSTVSIILLIGLFFSFQFEKESES